MLSIILKLRFCKWTATKQKSKNKKNSPTILKVEGWFKDPIYSVYKI